MAKQGMHHHDENDQDVSRGHNKHDKSVTITTGNYKKPETYEKQAHEHKATNKQGQEDKNGWIEDTRTTPNSITREAADEKRDGSDSNESTSTRGH